MTAYHSTSNWLGEPCRVRIEPDPDSEYERLLDEIKSENVRYAAQMKLFPSLVGRVGRKDFAQLQMSIALEQQKEEIA